MDPLNLTACVHHWAPIAGPGPTLAGSWTATYYRSRSDSDEGTRITVPDVPTLQEHVVQVWDLSLCNVSPLESPVSYRTLFANGVELTRVTTHASGMTGATFRVGSDGSILP